MLKLEITMVVYSENLGHKASHFFDLWKWEPSNRIFKETQFEKDLGKKFQKFDKTFSRVNDKIGGIF